MSEERSHIAMRITLDLRGKLYFWSLTLGGEQHDGAKGYSTAHEALEQCDLYRRMLKLGEWKRKERAKQAAP